MTGSPSLFPATGGAVVIGGSGGVGAEICRVLARDGCDVALTYFGNAARAGTAAKAVEAEGRRASIHRLNIEETEAVADLTNALMGRVVSLTDTLHEETLHQMVRWWNWNASE